MNRDRDLQLSDEKWWEQYCYGRELEETWKDSKPRLSKKELLEIYPEAKSIIPDKIAECCITIVELRNKVRAALEKLRQLHIPEIENYIVREWIKLTLVDELLEAEKHLNRLQNYMDIILNKKTPYKLTEEEIGQARQVPLHEVAESYIKLRRVNGRYVGLCPFHEERFPSFTIFPDNHFYCFGCQEQGDVIRFVELIESMNFYESVRHLLNK